MKYRTLRIAWSVWWGVLAVLLCVLWARSYWWWCSLTCGLTNQKRAICWMEDGVTAFTCFDLPIPRTNLERWEFQSYPPRSLASNSPMKTDSARLFLYRSRGGLTIGLPTWALAVAVGLLATASHIHWSKRFSVRTLLLITTAVAMALGLVMWAAQS